MPWRKAPSPVTLGPRGCRAALLDLESLGTSHCSLVLGTSGSALLGMPTAHLEGLLSAKHSGALKDLG